MAEVGETRVAPPGRALHPLAVPVVVSSTEGGCRLAAGALAGISMQTPSWRKIRLKHVLWAIALAVAAPFVVWAIELLRIVGLYSVLVTSNNGDLRVVSYLPPLRVSVSFLSDDMGERRPPSDMRPLLRQLKAWGAVRGIASEAAIPWPWYHGDHK